LKPRVDGLRVALFEQQAKQQANSERANGMLGLGLRSFEDQFIAISTQLEQAAGEERGGAGDEGDEPGPFVYGLAEHKASFRLPAGAGYAHIGAGYAPSTSESTSEGHDARQARGPRAQGAQVYTMYARDRGGELHTHVSCLSQDADLLAVEGAVTAERKLRQGAELQVHDTCAVMTRGTRRNAGAHGWWCGRAVR